ncbi:MAG: DNA-processing protein DprA [Proteobacteria bacterium]|nr:DNA-processing protein DprA [Pseudomonadota bacterium]
MHALAGIADRTPLTDAERLDRLRLIRSENVGPVTFFRLLEQFGSAGRALDALPNLARRGGRKAALKIAPKAAAAAEIDNLRELGGQHVYWGDAGYPPLLAEIDDAPPVLLVLGHAHLLTKKAIAVVGSRNASINGRRFAADMARYLGEAGFLVVSGMARGIDAAAHEGSLQTGTLAVLGGGVDVIYPKENTALYEKLVESGAICSEVELGTQPQARHFPRRNRIIAGAARGIVVIEAGAKSGSLITARLALEQGREVFAVPGAPQDPRAKGGNTLIREGAYLTETADDVISALAAMDPKRFAERRRDAMTPAPAAQPAEADTAEARRIVPPLLGFQPTDIDDVIRESDLSPAAVAVVLLEMELAGRIERHPGNRVSLLAASEETT